MTARTLATIVVLAATAAADPAPCDESCRCQSGDTSACLELSEKAFDSGQKDLAINSAISVCEMRDGEGCLRAAYYMDKIHVTERRGSTSKQLRERAISQFEQGCAASKGEACFRFGKILFQGKLVPVDETRGLALLEKGCTLNTGAACLFLGNNFDSKDPKRALAFLEKACAADSIQGCTALGARITDKARAATLFAKACDGDDALGCARSGGAAKAARDLAKAVASFEKACELDHPASCVHAGALRASGRGVTDPVKARTMYERGCGDQLGAACLGLAELVATTKGGARNWGQAVRLAKQACTLGTKAACSRATQIERRPPDWRCATAETCTSLCDEGVGRSCLQLVLIVAKGGGEDACDATHDVLAKGCEAGYGTGCVLRGNQESTQRDARDWYLAACKLGDTEGCALDAYIAGDDDPQGVLARACAAAKGSACVWYGKLTSTKDPANSRRVLRGACDRGQGRACYYAARAIERNSMGPWGIAATSSDVDDRTPAQLRADAAADREIRRLLAKGCALDDALSCAGDLRDPEEKRAARLEALAKKKPCGLADVRWDLPY